jgi:hypothetical protein
LIAGVIFDRFGGFAGFRLTLDPDVGEIEFRHVAVQLYSRVEIAWKRCQKVEVVSLVKDGERDVVELIARTPGYDAGR